MKTKIILNCEIVYKEPIENYENRMISWKLI